MDLQLQRVKNVTSLLHSKGLRMTAERVTLLHTILALKGHFTTENLLEKIKSKKMRVSRATVYRILPVLVEAEVIQQSLLSKEGQTQFEVTWGEEHHDHLMCSQCGKIVEFQHNTIELLQREIASKHGFILEHHVMELVGRCTACHK
jgi:Fur family ferric uptake transcriptional regulator